MKRIKTAVVIGAVLLMFLSLPFRVSGFIPVHDALKYIQDKIAHYAKMLKLAEIIENVQTILRIERETKEFFNNIYAVIRGSDLISAKEMLWQILNSAYLRDKYKNDPWWVVWQTDVKLEEMFPELLDFSYITDNFLYHNRREYREYADKVIAHRKEKVREYENLKDHLKLMRKAYEKNIEQINLFSNRLDEYAKGNHVGRLIGLIANLELMNARLNLTLNLNRRIMMTLKLKQETWNRVNYHREINREYWKDEE
ncbi:MAG: hypothetical protein KAT34_19830 [Candidatus Aminicenantes bacterium]|nr:hypothetical protein [Candidatus Aminicenantes bacterium]